MAFAEKSGDRIWISWVDFELSDSEPYEAPPGVECRVRGHLFEYDEDPGAPIMCQRCGQWIED